MSLRNNLYFMKIDYLLLIHLKLDLGNQDMNKNFCKKYYKNILNEDYEEIFDNKLKSIDNNSKLFLFKALKSENKSEFYLKYPYFEIRRLFVNLD